MCLFMEDLEKTDLMSQKQMVNNVLDGSSNSNFLIGGKGQDPFYVDDRSPATNIWSTIVNFHRGDNIAVWGLTAADFSVFWDNGLGAPGFTGLTGDLESHTPGQPVAGITLAGYTTADLTDGKLSISFGRTPDLPGLPGSNYLSIQAP
jgi:hypothetical protein